MHWLPSHQGLEDLVASSAKFRTLTGAASASAAEAFIFYGGVDDAPEEPRALISGEGASWEEVTAFSVEGSLILSIEVPATKYPTGTTKEKFAHFLTDIDTIISEMNTNGRDGTVNWRMTKVVPMVGPRLLSDQETVGDKPFYVASYMVSWT